jgi:glycosyltransferase involved in cell wall biosynthesis
LVAKRLRDEGFNIRLIILGRGELEKDLLRQIELVDAGEYIHLLGHVDNVMDYLGAADFLLHPSQLESSCVVVKEAGLTKKPVIVCQDIGDFNDYLVHGVNAFLVSKDAFVAESIEVLKTYYNKPKELASIGTNLHTSIITRFDINNVLTEYDDLNTVLKGDVASP